jgi:serine/threonine protein kinase
MLLSIVNGLVHLHMPIESYKGKPALAHCDLKSKNILVKANLTCCIGDLGLAVSGDKHGRVVLAPGTSLRTGTKRYLAPEILAKTIDQRFLNSFQKAEIYSLALIIWEVLRACEFESHTAEAVFHSFEYKLPYYEYIAAGDPDEALMRQIVCEQRLRPTIMPQWHEHPIMHELTKLCEEVWVENPNERLNALRIKKSITKIIQQNS